MAVKPTVGRFSSFFENGQVWVLECIERPDPVPFLKKYFHLLKTQAGFQTFCKKKISLGFQSVDSHTSYTSEFSKAISHTNYYTFHTLTFDF
jgi:hypothetical protein